MIGANVLFTDESHGRVLVWRDRGTHNPAFVRERSQHRRAGWMVLESAFTDLHIIRNGTLTGRRYADEILRNPLRCSHWRFLCFPG
ncbi:hypothetical protein TNCV_2006691 [Trichonephila clavipes]|nr:hypothetical protein TNCV_2006691 [Trichonephila clavipes]